MWRICETTLPTAPSSSAALQVISIVLINILCDRHPQHCLFVNVLLYCIADRSIGWEPFLLKNPNQTLEGRSWVDGRSTDRAFEGESSMDGWTGEHWSVRDYRGKRKRTSFLSFAWGWKKLETNFLFFFSRRTTFLIELFDVGKNGRFCVRLFFVTIITQSV